MSKQTLSQMEALLLDRIKTAKIKLEKLQNKHKLEIGVLAYKHGLDRLDLKQLDLIFSKITDELGHDHR